MNPTISKLYREANLCIDMFGRELKVGDTVLCKGYSSMDKDTVATVEKVGKTTISIKLERSYWNYSIGKFVIKEYRLMQRKPIDVMLISPELKTEIESREEYLIETYPEYFI